MGVGFIQLITQGHEYNIFNKEPQITFFKIFYRRHTNFSLEDIDQYFTHEINFGKKSFLNLSLVGKSPILFLLLISSTAANSSDLSFISLLSPYSLAFWVVIVYLEILTAFKNIRPTSSAVKMF